MGHVLTVFYVEYNQPFFNKWQQLKVKIDVSKSLKNSSRRMLDAVADSIFRFVDVPFHPSQSNFAPVEEIGEAVQVICIEGQIPADFPEGLYVRNGGNPLFGGWKAATSVFGETSQTWAEGEGMLHALYFQKNDLGNWTISYKNKFIETETFKLEKEGNRSIVIPTLTGDSLAVLTAMILNILRFGTTSKYYQNVSVFEHAKKLYVNTENYKAQEIDITTLETIDTWDFDGEWDRPFTSHPKKAPESGELIIMGIDVKKPYYVVGIISADGTKLLHKVDLKFKRSVLSHDIGVTQKYNVIIDHPYIFSTRRVIEGGSFLTYDEKAGARIGVMPRYGDADSVKWFVVEPNCTMHIVNCFDDGNEVVVRGCRANAGIISGPEWGKNKFEWYSKGYKINDYIDGSSENGYLIHRVYEWRLNMATGHVKERYLTTADFSMDFPVINEAFTGLKQKYGYTQVIHSMASSTSGIGKYSAIAKLYFDDYQSTELAKGEKLIETEYHKLPNNVYCTGITFVPKENGVDEDDGWIVTYVHNEESNVSQAYVIDAKAFGSEPAAIINLPHRVPYGFHGTFVSKK
ncbi:hypothetical protein K2173_016377 [Erythroxylum novogranatense]|uniref:Uncharacterized protein n=1 Tax=Erythroxylum novogranatense TaxID=1862640 RepID=A0AAV8SG20_9ROSI|nr:hypothetical protein K2173_016377 [Erythroxylum novogranatense]